MTVRAVVPCVALAVLSVVVLPTAMGFDPWAWVVWGREVTRLELDTTGGPSWKPLPVAVTTLVAPLGSWAPALWLIVARTGGLLLIVGTYRLAARFGGGAAGVVAAGLLLLTPDAEPRFGRTVLEGHTAPMAAALAVWAIDRHLAGRHRTAFLFAVGMALLRPEVWPFLIVYGVWLWRRERGLRPVIVVSATAIATLWFGVDWWGSGDPLHGAADAQVAAGSAWQRLRDALETVEAMVPLVAWWLAAWGAWTAWRRREAELLGIVALGVAWIVVVVAMSVVLGYAAISRFLLPPAALASVVAGIGAVRAVEALPSGRARPVIVGVALLVAVVISWPRLTGFGDVAREVEARTSMEEEIPAAIAGVGGRDAVLTCGRADVDGDSLLRPALAWELDVPLSALGATPTTAPTVAFVLTEGPEDVELAQREDATAMFRGERWAVYDVGCAS